MKTTEAMIDAGAEMLRGYDLDSDLPTEVAERVFDAMIGEKRDDVPGAIRINRLHSVYPGEIGLLHLVSPGTPDCWLEVTMKDGNTCQTELAKQTRPRMSRRPAGPLPPSRRCDSLHEGKRHERCDAKRSMGIPDCHQPD
jgi:hypothetical protein